jgi:hypothetical protein
VKSEVLSTVSGDGEDTLMESAVMLRAQEQKVVQDSQATIGPVNDVVGVEELGPPAAGDRAAVIAAPESMHLAGARCSVSRADVEDGAVTVDRGDSQPGVVEKAIQDGRPQGWAVIEMRAGLGAGMECLSAVAGAKQSVEVDVDDDFGGRGKGGDGTRAADPLRHSDEGSCQIGGRSGLAR